MQRQLTACLLGLRQPSAVTPAHAVCVRRTIHTPPGGFVEELPTSFGRTAAKGEISSVNLRRKSHDRLRRRARRQRLAIPEAVSADRIKRALLTLKERTTVTSGRRSEGAQSTIQILESSAAIDEVSDNYFNRVGAINVARQEFGDSEYGALTTVGSTPSCGDGRTLLDSAIDAAVSERTAMGEGNRGAQEEASTSEKAGAESVDPVVPPEGSALRLVTTSGLRGGWQEEQALERRYAVTPGSTVFGSDLDRLERDMLRDFEQQGGRLPPLDQVYSAFGAGRVGKRMAWEPSSSFEKLTEMSVLSNRRNKVVLGDASNRNLSPYHMSAEAYRERQEWLHTKLSRTVYPTGFSRSPRPDSAAEEGKDLPASENPHFPTFGENLAESTERHDEGDSGSLPYHRRNRVVEVDARRDYSPRLTTVGIPGNDDLFTYDAFNQRPSEQGMVELRGVDYWNDSENRRRVEEHENHRRQSFAREQLEEGAMDTGEVEYSVSKVRKEVFLYFQHHPINEMIQEAFVRIREVAPKDGSAKVVFRPQIPLEMRSSPTNSEVLQTLNMDVDVPIQEARRLAQDIGLDLIRIGALHTDVSDRRVVALCLIGDHREHMREMVKFKIQKLGVQPPPTNPCIEVPFRGGTHPHAIRFKSVGIAKHILKRHVIRLNLTKFGTPREGFPVFQCILDEVKRQCLQLKAYHRAGAIQTNYNEIYCFLYPSTGRSPKTTVDHPSATQVREARDFHVLENEKQIYFDDLHNRITPKDRLRYLTMLEKGTAWADKDDGLSLQRQRSIKVMLGYIPKGNREIYAARGDVNIPAPFRASHPTSIEKWSYTMESNLEQASRGAAALGKRASMPISEMHDRGETPENATQLDRFYYKVQGPALEVGELKEALGLKDNRRKRPPLSSGFATLGGPTSGSARHAATK